MSLEVLGWESQKGSNPPLVLIDLWKPVRRQHLGVQVRAIGPFFLACAGQFHSHVETSVPKGPWC